MRQRFRTIHPFPARMAPELALEELPSIAGPLKILDPMSGSGTTLVAARLNGHEAIGFDRDPLAVLIARAWVSDLNAEVIHKKALEILDRAKIRASAITTASAFPHLADEETKRFVKFWFDTDNRKQLAALAASIRVLRDEKVRNVLWCAFSRLIITKKAGASLAMDVSHSRPHKAYDKAPHRAFDRFILAVNHIIKSAPFAEASAKAPDAKIKSGDARKMPLKAQSIDLIITSPPYLNAIDYLRGHKLSLVWMGHSIADLRLLRSTNVGTERSTSATKLDPALALVVEKMCSGEPLNQRSLGMLEQYVRDLHALLRECHRVLKDNGRAVFVLGDCNIKKTFVANSVAVELIGRHVGFTIESSRRRPLPENRRYLPPPDAISSGASMQKRMREEVILTLRK